MGIITPTRCRAFCHICTRFQILIFGHVTPKIPVTLSSRPEMDAAAQAPASQDVYLIVGLLVVLLLFLLRLVKDAWLPDASNLH